jgi:hypothetical protein
MSHRHLIPLLFLLSGSVLPVATSAQQPDAKPTENHIQSPNTPQVQSQGAPVQPDRTPQQSDQAREQDKRSAEDTRINPDWTARQHNDEHMGMDRHRRMDQDQDSRTVGRNWHPDYGDQGRGSYYRDDDRYYDEPRPRRRIKICTEYPNGDEFCHYRD